MRVHIREAQPLILCLRRWRTCGEACSEHSCRMEKTPSVHNRYGLLAVFLFVPIRYHGIRYRADSLCSYFDGRCAYGNSGVTHRD